MGLFSGKKIISVASTVYNLAGEEKDRPQYLESLMFQNIYTGSKESIARTTMNGYLNGPSMRIRQFFKWVRKPENYGLVGMPTGAMLSGSALNPDMMEPFIPGIVAPDEAWVQHAPVGVADTSYWAEQYIMVNRPNDLNEPWASDYDKITNKITIRFNDNSTVLFTPANFDFQQNYVYAYYIKVHVDTAGKKIYSKDNLYIYRIGSGNTELDKLALTGTDYGQFFPFIPFRLDNDFLSEIRYPDVFDQALKAYKKATGASLKKLIDDVADNDQLGDIDNAYVVFGVSLNVVEMACKRYLYTFFAKLQNSQIGGPHHYDNWLNLTDAQKVVYDKWTAWKKRSNDPDFNETLDPEPPRPHLAELAKNEIRIASQSGTINSQYDIRLQWSFITDGEGTGLGRPGAIKNDCWLQYLGTDDIARNYFTMSTEGDQDSSASYTKIRIYWQRETDFYTYLDVYGLQHRNFIYGGKSVDISAAEALADNDESGFIVPLHYETWRETSIIDSSQMSTACIFVVFNSYVVKKQKWYESGIFRIFLIIIIAIVSVVFTGGAGIGLLGAHLTVGTALGFTGMTAAIVGSVVNALAAMVLSTILEKVATSLGIIGPIVAAILGIVIGGVINAFQSGGAFTFNWGSLLRADNLIKLTESVAGGFQVMMQNENMRLQEESQTFGTKTESAMKKIQEAYVADFGYGALQIDPFVLTSSGSGWGEGTNLYSESPDAFLARTTLTGTDIVNMSQDMLYNFAEYSLKLPDAFV
jgi:hypothetical protein